jgi:hypothetical protein
MLDNREIDEQQVMREMARQIAFMLIGINASLDERAQDKKNFVIRLLPLPEWIVFSLLRWSLISTPRSRSRELAAWGKSWISSTEPKESWGSRRIMNGSSP